MTTTANQRERQLLAEGRTLRHLARALLGNGVDADDLVQDTLAAALASPRPDAAQQPWLVATLRNLVRLWRRSAARRAARERLAAVPERQHADDPAAVAQQAELVRDVAAAVHALDEPFRTAVVLRFWHGLRPEAIARELDVPKNTVRSRLQRGLERLRARLDHLHGDRARWSVPMVTLCLPRALPPAVAAATGSAWLAGMLMQTKLLLGAAAVLVAAVAIPWSIVARRPAAQPPTPPQSLQPVAAATEPASPQRELAPAPTPPPAPTSAAAAFDASPARVEPWRAQFVVVDEAATPVADATILVWPAQQTPIGPELRKVVGEGTRSYHGHAPEPLLRLLTDADGRACATLQLEQVEVAATSPTRGSTGEQPLHWRQAERGEVRLVVERPIPIRGTVRGADGAPVANARVEVLANQESSRNGRRPPPPPVTSDAEGRFELAGHLGFSYRLFAHAGDAASQPEEVALLDRSQHQVLLVFPGAITIAGLVLDLDGRPLAEATVSLWREFDRDDPARQRETAQATTDGNGRFTVPVRAFARYQLLAAAAGRANSELQWTETTAARPHADVVLRLRGFTSIAGRVLHADGSPFAGVIVRARPESGTAGDRRGGPVPSADDRFARVVESTTDARGAFGLQVTPGVAWTLLASPLPQQQFLRYPLRGVLPGSLDNCIVLDEAQLAGCRVHGSVVAEGGRPLEEFGIDLLLEDDTGATSSFQLDLPVRGNTFELPRLALGTRFSLTVQPFLAGTKLRYCAPLAPRWCGPFCADRPEIEVRAQVARWAEQAVRVLQADGSPARGVMVGAAPVGTVSFSTQPVAVDGDGRASLQCLPGPTSITVWREQQKLCEQPLTLQPGSNAETTVRLPGTAGAGATADAHGGR